MITDYKAAMMREPAYEETSAPAYSQPLPVPPVATRTVRALYPLNTGMTGELAFKEGDMIEVIREDPSGWWEGKLDGQVGRFPSNYTTASFLVC